MYNPFDWYWFAEDGRVFASARQALVTESDAGYVVALAAGTTTPWPRELNGIQTDAALQAVLAPYNMFVDLKSYASYRRWQFEIGGIDFNGVPIATDDRSKLMITGGRIAADADASWTTIWQGSDGNSYPLNAAAMIAISDAVQAHVSSCFAIYATVISNIDGGTVTSRTQVDAEFVS